MQHLDGMQDGSRQNAIPVRISRNFSSQTVASAERSALGSLARLADVRGKNKNDLPSFNMANARSICNKFDELTAQLLTYRANIGVITES